MSSREIARPAYPERKPRPDEPSPTVVLFVVIGVILAMTLLAGALYPDQPARSYGDMDAGLDYDRPAR